MQLSNSQLVLSIAVIAAAISPPVLVGSSKKVAITERLRGAELAVVGHVVGVSSALERNEHGDELIVSYATLKVDESLKGAAGGVETIAVEGGTYGGYTLRVSDMPSMTPGIRGVFLVNRGNGKAKRPHLRGQGILLLDAQNRVQGEALTLDDIRAAAKAAK
jgi:hypothetical protein